MKLVSKREKKEKGGKPNNTFSWLNLIISFGNVISHDTPSEILNEYRKKIYTQIKRIRKTVECFKGRRDGRFQQTTSYMTRHNSCFFFLFFLRTYSTSRRIEKGKPTNNNFQKKFFSFSSDDVVASLLLPFQPTHRRNIAKHSEISMTRLKIGKPFFFLSLKK